MSTCEENTFVMTQLSHFVFGQSTPSAGATIPIINPATGREIGLVPMGLASEVDAAIAAAKAALPAWSALGLQQRINLLFDLRQCLAENKDEVINLVVTETGKTLTDATVEVTRAVEIIGHATATTILSATPYTRGVATGINTYEVRYPVGVVAAISPFNFPVMIPMLQTMMAIACGNTVVAKPSERNPSALLYMAELFTREGLPKGVFNVVLGDRTSVERIIEHPDVAAITFVGSSPVARHIRIQGVAHNKRVQAFGSGKNHLVIMPDTDVGLAASAAVSSAFGAAGQRCMAVSVVVAVGSIADELVKAIKIRAAAMPIGNVTERSAQLGPVISERSRQRIASFVENAAGEGADVVLDGRRHTAGDEGWYFGPTIIDNVKPGTAAHREEIFGPVLSIVRVDTYEEAIGVISASDLGNGAAIFTRDGSLATRFTDDAPAGQIGINVPIPSPVYFHGFAGWKDSAFTETKMHGRDTIDFLTRTKTVTANFSTR
jgi:malonate-semialdehyde dehydrogenase (acetylating)/methylmalonate-semialdehyde dehydrogenase